MHFSRYYMALGVQFHAPVALPPGKGPGMQFTGNRVGCRSCLDGCGEEKNILSSPDFELRAVQPTEHLYTDYAMPVPHTLHTAFKFHDCTVYH